MKKLILLISIFFLFFNSFSQETSLYLNFEELKKENVIYEIYVVIDLFEESRAYRYIINNETINDIVYLSPKPWNKLPIEKEFYTETIDIWYIIKSGENCIEGEFKETIKLCKNNFFKFKKTWRGIKVKKCKL